jgi:hypothetical protein
MGSQIMELSDLIRRAWEDPEFKRRLLSQPRATIEDALGVTLPAGLNVYVHEQTPTDLHLVLPMPPAASQSEGPAQAA